MKIRFTKVGTLLHHSSMMNSDSKEKLAMVRNEWFNIRLKTTFDVKIDQNCCFCCRQIFCFKWKIASIGISKEMTPRFPGAAFYHLLDPKKAGNQRLEARKSGLELDCRSSKLAPSEDFYLESFVRYYFCSSYCRLKCKLAVTKAMSCTPQEMSGFKRLLCT